MTLGGTPSGFETDLQHLVFQLHWVATELRLSALAVGSVTNAAVCPGSRKRSGAGLKRDSPRQGRLPAGGGQPRVVFAATSAR